MGWDDLAVIAIFVAFAVPLWRHDVAEHRLPDRYTLPLFASELSVMTVAAAQASDWVRLGLAVVGAAALTLIYFVLALIPGGVGYGDVKLALSIGLTTAWWSVDAWVLALCATFLVGGCAAVWVWIRGGGLRTHVAFGPAMLIGWALAAAASVAALA